MRITFLGHAGLEVEAARFRLVCDPWFAESGANLGSWHPYPRNDHLDIPALQAADWVAISHEHLDHFDPEFLASLDEHTQVLIPRYPTRRFRDCLTAAGVKRIIEIEPWRQFPLDNAGSWLTVIPEASPMFHDSAFLLVSDGRSLLNCNDAKLTVTQARKAKHIAGGRLDLMGLQASLAAWHPMAYDSYSSEDIARISWQKKQAKFRAVARLVRGTAPDLAVPFAGPPCFLDDELRQFNWVLERGAAGAYADPEESAAWLTEKVPQQRWATFKPGDCLDLSKGAIERDPLSEAFDYADRGMYIARYAADRRDAVHAVHAAYPDPPPSLYELFTAHFTWLGSLSQHFNQRVDMTVRFEVAGPHGGVWDVTFASEGVTVGIGLVDVPSCVLKVAGRWLLPVLTGDVTWESLMLSLRMRFWRDPDVYNDYLIGLFKHADETALRAVEEYDKGRDETETIVVTDAGGARFEVGRYCPHSGEDLATGSVLDDRRLTCLRHGFTFDLNTGACVNARCAPLTTRQVTSAAGEQREP
ncbi:Rieske 2Fe-2S domain-containing protein [Streptomyces sp. NPDC004752]